MTYEWDDQKNVANRIARGLDFADAERVFDGLVLTTEDERQNYGEPRFNSLGLLEGRVVNITHTPRGEDVTRIISMRKATKNEEKIYFKEVYGE
jgi:uncharacterized protein